MALFQITFKPSENEKSAKQVIDLLSTPIAADSNDMIKNMAIKNDEENDFVIIRFYDNSQLNAMAKAYKELSKTYNLTFRFYALLDSEIKNVYITDIVKGEFKNQKMASYIEMQSSNEDLLKFYKLCYENDLLSATAILNELQELKNECIYNAFYDEYIVDNIAFSLEQYKMSKQTIYLHF